MLVGVGVDFGVAFDVTSALYKLDLQHASKNDESWFQIKKKNRT